MMLSKAAFLTSAFKPISLGDRLREVRVHADHGLAVGGDELVRRVGRVGGDAQLAARLDVGRHLARDRRVLLDGEASPRSASRSLVLLLSLLLLPQPAATVTAANAITAIRAVSLDLISGHSPLGLGYVADLI